MALDLDGWLLDRVFQPVSDHLADRASCFDLARVALAAAAALQLVVLAAQLHDDGDGLRRAVCGGITLLALFGADRARHVVARAERQSRPGLMNIRRITLRWQRSAWLAMAIWTALSTAMHASVATGALLAASLCWMGCVFFASCSQNQPRHARQLTPPRLVAPSRA